MRRRTRIGGLRPSAVVASQPDLARQTRTGRRFRECRNRQPNSTRSELLPFDQRAFGTVLAQPDKMIDESFVEPRYAEITSVPCFIVFRAFNSENGLAHGEYLWLRHRREPYE